MKAKLLITSIVVLAIVAAPVAGAGEYRGPGGPGAGGPVLLESELAGEPFVGGPGAGGPVVATDVFGYEPIASPGAGGPLVGTTSAASGDGLEWIATGIGTALVVGIGLLAAVMLLRSRHRSTMAMP